MYSELGAGIGLLGTAFISLKAISHITMISEVSDVLTRFSGIDICWIRPGVIWSSQPESFIDVIFSIISTFSCGLLGFTSLYETIEYDTDKRILGLTAISLNKILKQMTAEQ